jgi:hypothetical protein
LIEILKPIFFGNDADTVSPAFAVFQRCAPPRLRHVYAIPVYFTPLQAFFEAAASFRLRHFRRLIFFLSRLRLATTPGRFDWRQAYAMAFAAMSFHYTPFSQIFRCFHRHYFAAAGIFAGDYFIFPAAAISLRFQIEIFSSIRRCRYAIILYFFISYAIRHYYFALIRFSDMLAYFNIEMTA